MGNSADKLRHPRSDAYPAEQVLLNMQQIRGGGARLYCYPTTTNSRSMEQLRATIAP